MKKRILIVDDEKNIRIALKQCFKGENYKVEMANDGNLAQKYYRAALSLDVTYAPADNNLRRTAMYSSLSTGIDLG